MKLTTLGLRHLALYVKNFEACETFYTHLVGMTVTWRPDEHNIYLTSGQDNLALHRAPSDFDFGTAQHLDHLGFMLKSEEDVTKWYEFLHDQGVTIKTLPKKHRDNAVSFYCYDPDGNAIQFIYLPGIT